MDSPQVQPLRAGQTSSLGVPSIPRTGQSGRKRWRPILPVIPFGSTFEIRILPQGETHWLHMKGVCLPGCLGRAHSLDGHYERRHGPQANGARATPVQRALCACGGSGRRGALRLEPRDRRVLRVPPDCSRYAATRRARLSRAEPSGWKDSLSPRRPAEVRTGCRSASGRPSIPVSHGSARSRPRRDALGAVRVPELARRIGEGCPLDWIHDRHHRSQVRGRGAACAPRDA